MPPDTLRLTVKKIPRFPGSELKAIAELLHTEGIDFDFEGVTTGLSRFGADTEYLLVVSESQFIDTLALLIDYYLINEGTSEPYTGDCPACGFKVVNFLECPDCGLSFTFETPVHIKSHPFYKFLEQNSLLPID